MKTVENINDATKPIYYLSLITATTSAIRDKTGEWIKIKWQILQTIIYVAVCTALTMLSVKSSVYPFPVLEKSGIIIFITHIYIHGINIVPVPLFIISQIFGKTKIIAYKGMEEIELTLKKMGLQNVLEESNYILRKYTVILLSLAYAVNFLIILIITVIFYDFPIYQITTYLASIIICASVKLQYYSWTVILRERFKILNDLLQKEIIESTKTVKYPVDEDAFSRDIETIVEQHKKLNKIARAINLCYSFPLLAFAALSFVILITQGYILIYILTLGHSDTNSSQDHGSNFLIVNSFQYVLYAAFELFIIIRFTTLMCFQANNTKEVLHGIRIHPEKVESRNLVISTLLHLMHDKLEISACRLFNVDFSLLHSICAAVTIYLVIMLQFDIDANKKKKAKE